VRLHEGANSFTTAPSRCGGPSGPTPTPKTSRYWCKSRPTSNQTHLAVHQVTMASSPRIGTQQPGRCVQRAAHGAQRSGYRPPAEPAHDPLTRSTQRVDVRDLRCARRAAVPLPVTLRHVPAFMAAAALAIATGCAENDTQSDDSSLTTTPSGGETSVQSASPSSPTPSSTRPSPGDDGSTPDSTLDVVPEPTTTSATPSPDSPGSSGSASETPLPTSTDPEGPGGAAGTPQSVSAGGNAGEGSGGAGNESNAGGRSATGEHFEPAFILGADISSVPEAEDNGTTYRDTDGQEAELLSILANHGFNYIRLRTFVDPMAPYGYAAGTGDCQQKREAYNDRDHTVAHAERIKAAGLGFLLDFHYSDTWADPAKQVMPEAWRDISDIDGLADAVYEYTHDVLDALDAANALPDMVQVGNEITPGMMVHVPTANTDCWGNNSTGAPLGGSISNWDNLATLLKAGIRAVRDVDPAIKVMLHVESTDDLNGTRNWVRNAVDRGVEFDVLGLSCYSKWQGPPSVWENTFTTLAREYPELSFAIAEYNPERREANRIMRDLPDGRGLGTFFWEPTQSGEWGESMFDWNGNVQSARAADFAEYDAIADEYGL